MGSKICDNYKHHLEKTYNGNFAEVINIAVFL